MAEINKGKQLNKTELRTTGEYAYNGGKSYSGFTNKYNVQENTIIISQGGASAGFVNFIKTKFWANAHCYFLSPNLDIVDNRFLYHFLKLNERYFMEFQHGAGIPALATSKLKNHKIPLPPLTVQQKIAEILDRFTQLEAELVLRKKQYEYYRNHLLTPDENNLLNGKKVEWKTLGEVTHYSKSRISYENLDENNYVGVDNLLQNKQGKTLSNHIPEKGNVTAYFKDDILIGNIRPYLKKIWQANNDGGASGDVLVVHLTDNSVNSRYLYQVLSDDNFFAYNMQHAKGAKMPRGSKEMILDYKIPIPPMEEQERIAGILDKFDTLVNSISEGLPKEIKLRRKQYEYYREKLLSFQ